MFQKIKRLFVNLAIYGLGDVITSIVSFLLLPLYVKFLSPTDYGVIGLLLTVEVIAKIVFRWGVDASFMRFYYECADHAARQRLASTIFLFLLAVNGALLLAALALAPTIAEHLFGAPGFTLVLRLVLINIFIVGFYFIPFHVLRILDKPSQFIALTFSRAAGTIIVRLLLVAVAGMGVTGVVVADLLVTAIFTLVLARWFAPLLRPMFSRKLLVEALRFGLPRVPHGVAHQVMAVADRYLLSIFATLRDVGLYSIGASFGLALKLFLSAFEYAWAPFYFGTMKEPDAKQTFSRVTTYGLAVLVFLATGLSAVATDAVRLMTSPAFHGAERFVPWIALGVMLQGVYLLTSIGLNITKRTEFYPISTAVAAGVSVSANLWLIPKFGALGAAWSNTLAYAVLAATSAGFSHRFYPIRYEYGRIVRLVLAGVACYGLAALALPQLDNPLVGLLVRGFLVGLGYPALLFVSGFFRPREIEQIYRMAGRVWPSREPEPAVETAELAGEIVGTPMPGLLEERPTGPLRADAERATRVGQPSHE